MPLPPGTCAMPRFATATGSHRVTSVPSNVIVPPLGRTRPLTAFSNVDFPAPLVPSSATTSPRRISRSTPKSTRTPS